MPIVLTLTANLLAETTYDFASWEEGATHRALAESFQVGGKGINVTRMLRRLGGVDSTALYFPGGATGERCSAWLRGHDIAARAFPTPRETRTGAVIRADGRLETTFLGHENVISAEAYSACAEYINGLQPGAALAVCGSIPGWRTEACAPLREALARHAGHSFLSVDTYGDALDALSDLPAALVKINRKEFAGPLGVDLKQLTDTRMHAALQRHASTRPAARWIVTDGPNTVWFAERNADAAAATTGNPVAVRSIVPPATNEVSATGSGDVLHAAVLHGLLVRSLSLEESLRFALPLAAANAASPGIADFDLGPFGIS